MKIIEILNKINGLKSLKRQGWIQKGLKSNEVESVADHSFKLAIITLFLQDYWEKLGLNSNKMLKMALIHDLGEAIIGDITPRDNVEDKIKKENEAVNQLIKLTDFFNDYSNIWEEFIKAQSEEAKIIIQLDKLEMALQALDYAGKDGDEIYDEFFLSVENSIREPYLKKIFNHVKL